MDASGVATTSEAYVVDSPEEDKPSGGAGMGGMGSMTYYNLTSDCTLLVNWLTLIHSSSGAENGHIGLLTLVKCPTANVIPVLDSILRIFHAGRCICYCCQASLFLLHVVFARARPRLFIGELSTFLLPRISHCCACSYDGAIIFLLGHFSD